MLLELTEADHNRTSWISAHLLYSPSLHIELTSCGIFSTDVAQILLMYSFTVGLPVSHLVSRPVSDASTHTQSTKAPVHGFVVSVTSFVEAL